MALLKQIGSRHALLGVAVAGLTGIGSLATGFLPWNWSISGTISSSHSREWEHPLRRRILTTLESNPGICYRRLQKNLDVANGTLRHHLDVLQTQRTVTTMPVNGRTCYYAGAPSQIEILRDMKVEDEKAAEMLPVGLSQVQREVVTRLVQDPLPQSQASLARDISRSRASVNSAILVLRRRGILSCKNLDLADHLHGLRTGTLDYEWIDERPIAA
ncbi:MAG: winged helix-turn-helix transcriptional regulator [Euryarchaeota archaeon]|jgi:predicted transcriptional regulator|nr:winged helix-turn-helix transcriptional regulator [Euryarchaeota archaeon]